MLTTFITCQLESINFFPPLVQEAFNQKLESLFFLTSADDMGLGKTLTMIALILGKKNEEKKDKEGKEEKEGKKLEKWLSKTGNHDLMLLF